MVWKYCVGFLVLTVATAIMPDVLEHQLLEMVDGEEVKWPMSVEAIEIIEELESGTDYEPSENVVKFVVEYEKHTKPEFKDELQKMSKEEIMAARLDKAHRLHHLEDPAAAAEKDQEFNLRDEEFSSTDQTNESDSIEEQGNGGERRRLASWKKVIKRHCWSYKFGGSYTSYSAAQAACNKLTDCEAVYNYGCRSTTFYLCPKGYKQQVSSSSCLYLKPKTGLWDDGTICGLMCNLCRNGSSYWWGKAFIACGSEPKWDIGTICARGTTCKACRNGSSYWWGKAITACGSEPKWDDGTKCLLGTTCKACRNGASYWWGKLFTACGKERCWGRGTVCGSGTTCRACCHGSKCPWYWVGICKCK